MESVEALSALFSRLGLNPTKAAEAAGSRKLAPVLRDICCHAGVKVESQAPENLPGQLLYYLATTMPSNIRAYLPFLTSEIMKGSLDSNERVTAAIRFFDGLCLDKSLPQSNAAADPFDEKAYEESCGIGVKVSPQFLETEIAKICNESAEIINSQQHRARGILIAAAKRHAQLRWASSLDVTKAIDAELLKRLGPKDLAPKSSGKNTKSVASENKEIKVASPAPKSEKSDAETPLDLDAMLRSMFFDGEMAKLHKPGENPQLSSDIMKAHLERTKGKAMTRFPPEPNGFLHIGHAKAINIDFGYAFVHKGFCYLRYDDTNPEAEEQRYFDSILDSVRWLGFEPDAITYSSDYFDKLYELACKLIDLDLAYVCHCTAEEIFAQRGGTLDDKKVTAAAAASSSQTGTDNAAPVVQCRPCVHRDRPVAESRAEFEKMHAGHYNECEAVLRMKMDLTSGNPQMWDLAAYRVKKTPHCRTGDKWRIYPTYDYTHCICDSLEDITHSLCTLEFRQSRVSYYWLVDALRIYRPVQWESARLNITNTVLSKRKLNKLVTESHVNGWDDPRIYTLVGLRRRGVPADAVNAFARSLGITLSNSTTDVARLDYYVRHVLNLAVPRLMAVMSPLRVKITNLLADHAEKISAFAVSPVNAALGSRSLEFYSEFFIEQSDFMLPVEDDAAGAPVGCSKQLQSFKRLTKSQCVGLLHTPYALQYESHEKDPATGKISLLCGKVVPLDTVKPKGFIQWVSVRSGVHVEARNYAPLFKHANPDSVSGGWFSDINPDSLHIEKDAVVDTGLLEYVRKAREAAGDSYTSARFNDSARPEATGSQMAVVDDLKFQFTRVGYYCVDPDSDLTSKNEKDWKIVVNRTIGLREGASK